MHHGEALGKDGFWIVLTITGSGPAATSSVSPRSREPECVLAWRLAVKRSSERITLLDAHAGSSVTLDGSKVAESHPQRASCVTAKTAVTSAARQPEPRMSTFEPPDLTNGSLRVPRWATACGCATACNKVSRSALTIGGGPLCRKKCQYCGYDVALRRRASNHEERAIMKLLEDELGSDRHTVVFLSPLRAQAQRHDLPSGESVFALGRACVLALEAWQERAGRFVREWLDVVGEAEALSSLAGLARGLDRMRALLRSPRFGQYHSPRSGGSGRGDDQ
jgi:hypothetical protein